MVSTEKFKCDYCSSVLGSKYIKNAHMKRNKACLKKRGLELSTTLSKYCVECGFISNTHLAGHTCRPESIAMNNQIKLLNITINDKD
jgi:hypothetical protein